MSKAPIKPKSPEDISVGDKVRDRVTGFTGIATGKAIDIIGCVRYTIEGAYDGKQEDSPALLVDWQVIEVLKNGAIPYVQQPYKPGFAIGDKVKDQISGFEGIAVRVIHFINGCSHVTVERGKEDGSPESVQGPWQRYKLVETDAFVLPDTAVEPSRKSNGGPTMRFVRDKADRR
jgi:hypothetical protein